MGSGLLVRHRVGLGVAVRRRPRDALLLPAPGIIVGGVTDVVVDEGVGLLPVWIQLVLAVAALFLNEKEIFCYTLPSLFVIAYT